MTPKHQVLWLRAVRKYRKLVETRVSSTSRHPNRESLLRRKLDILRRRLLHMNHAWKLGIATASLMAWLNAPAMGQFPAVFELSDLDGSNGFVLNGVDAYDLSGAVLSSAGDVNGDGIDDIIIGAFSASSSGSIARGESYIIFGNNTGFSSELNLSTLNGSNGFIVQGINAYDRLGESVSSAGDVNGDGITDIIIGAYNANYSGQSYVIFGNNTGGFSTGSFDLLTLNGNNGFSVNGVDSGDNSGRSASSAGDVNGDGVDDLLIGANGANSFTGEGYIVFGNSNPSFFGSSLDLALLDGSNGFTINGIDAFDQSNFSASLAGDVNDDGIDDLIIGALGGNPNGNYSGESYVVFGDNTGGFSTGVLDLSALDGSNGFIINGIDANDFSGYSVSSAGDVNGDGIDDILIGAFRAESYSGESYVIFGNSTGAFSTGNLELSNLNGSNGFIISGVDAQDRSSSSLSLAGDVNGDGFDDLIIGAYRADPSGRSEAGESYVVFGNNTGGFSTGIIDLSALDGINGFVINGIDAGDQSGRSVSSAGDVNGDGINDLIVGAWYVDSNGNSGAGASYVVFGQCHSITPTISITVSPTSTAEDASTTITYTLASSVNACSSDIVVNFSVSGTASPTTDYTLSGATTFDPMTGNGTATIIRGSNSTMLTITPIGDAVVEPDETVIVTVENP